MFETAMFYEIMEKLQQRAHANSKDKGFWDGEDNRNIPSKICLIHSELSEMLEAFRSGNPDCTKTLPDMNGNPLPLAIMKSANWKTMKSIEEEAADVFIRLLDLCEYLGIDLAQCTLVKMRYNEGIAKMHGGKKI